MHPVHVKNQIFPENQKEQVSIKWQSKNLYPQFTDGQHPYFALSVTITEISKPNLLPTLT